MTSTTGSRATGWLDIQACWGLLARDTIGRVAYTHETRPAIVPVNYVVSGNDILFRTDPESALGRVVDAKVVAFEVDRIDRPTRSGWSVVVSGVATTTDLTGQPPRPSLAGLEPWAAGERGLLVRIEVDAISGRRLTAPEAAARRRWYRR